MDAKLHKKIQDRIEKGTLRSLSSFEGMIDFLSNDYLGLSKSHSSEGPYEGSTGSRLISGNRISIDEAEASLAEFFGKDAALCFNSGYDANLGIFSSIPQKGDVVLYDEQIHASVRDGLRLSLARTYSFNHNSLDDLERLIIKFKDQTVYVAVEALYSMSGDFSPLSEITKLCKKNKCYLIVDEAHSAGVVGEKGRGFCDSLGLNDGVYIKLVTFGKAYGGHGGVVLCDADVKEYLVNFARSFIYSTALPVRDYEYMRNVVRKDEIDERKEALMKNISNFREIFSGENLVSDTKSPIQIIQIKDVVRLRSIQDKAQDNGLAIKAIYPPTVQKGDECIRVCLHNFNSLEEIQELYQQF